MKINIIDGNHKKARKRIDEVLSIYNGESMFAESFSNDYPEKTRVVYFVGHAGGIIIETIYKGGAFIYYAALDKALRYQGNLKRLMDAYERETNNKILGVQVNPFDPVEMWNKRGFVNQCFFNGALTYLNIPNAELVKQMEIKPNNEEF